MINTEAHIPDTIVLSPTNEVQRSTLSTKNYNCTIVLFEKMNLINDICLKQYRHDHEIRTSEANNYPWNPDTHYKKHKMAEHNPGCLPPHLLNLKVGCSLMLLRNLNVHDGLANGTRLRLLEMGRKCRTIKCEVLTGPKFKKPVVTSSFTNISFSFCLIC